MLWLGGVIVGVWAILFGGAYGLRRQRWGRAASACVLTGAYGGLCGMALLWFGPHRAALLGMFGMLLPFAAGLLLVQRWPA